MVYIYMNMLMVMMMMMMTVECLMSSSSKYYCCFLNLVFEEGVYRCEFFLGPILCCVGLKFS